MSDVTRILSAVEQGDPHAAKQLLPLVYDELRRLAVRRLKQEKAGQTLQFRPAVPDPISAYRDPGRDWSRWPMTAVSACSP